MVVFGTSIRSAARDARPVRGKIIGFRSCPGIFSAMGKIEEIFDDLAGKYLFYGSASLGFVVEPKQNSPDLWA
jgi:hypothetical protein